MPSDQSRPVATSPDSDFTLTIDEACDLPELTLAPDMLTLAAQT
jgi:hypothetical protein